jgi:hypothetical protein
MFPVSGTEISADQLFIGSQVKEAINDNNFDEVLKGTEKTAWEAFKLANYNFLGGHKGAN